MSASNSTGAGKGPHLRPGANLSAYRDGYDFWQASKKLAAEKQAGKSDKAKEDK